jgi:hypothetical protein
MNPRPSDSGGEQKRIPIVSVDKVVRDIIATRSREVAEKISAVLFQHDPVGLSLGTNHDAYDAQAQALISKLLRCGSEEHVAAIVFDEFTREFGALKAGSSSEYAEIGRAIWLIWIDTK